MPDNITLLPLPPSAAEVQWRTSGSSSETTGSAIFTSYDDIVDRCCDAWNRLNAQPWKIMSLGLHDWAYRL